MSDMPRRHQMLQWIPAELAIFDAIQAVELVGADVRLTEAVNLLGKGQALVADFVDGVPLGEGYPRNVGTDDARRLAEVLDLLRTEKGMVWSPELQGAIGRALSPDVGGKR